MVQKKKGIRWAYGTEKEEIDDPAAECSSDSCGSIFYPAVVE